MTTAILCIVWVLWPLFAFAGGLGFSPLAAVVAMVTLPAAIRKFRVRPYMVVFATFFVFAAVSALWSPLGAPIADIDFSKLRFNIKSDVLRVGLLFLAFGIVMAAAMKLDDRGRRIAGAFAMWALLVQLVIVVLLSFFESQALQLFAGFMPTSDEGVQNISRNAQILAVVAPCLAITLAESRWRIAGIAAAAAVLAATAAALAVREVFAGLLALAAAAAAIGVVIVFRRSGFRIIAAVIAAVVLAAPLIFGFLSRSGDAATASDTISYRMAIWKRVMEVVTEHPIWGSGVGVLRTIQERIPSGVFKGQLLVPNHAHNMTLQLWAETGVIGAVLLAGAILLAGWRMPPPSELGRTGWRAAAIAAALFANACVSFDLWNAGWWGMAGFLAVLVLATPRATPAEQAAGPKDVGITFNPASTSSNEAAAVQEAGEGRRPPALAPHTDNNFNLLRLIFALMVAVYHAMLLPGLSQWAGLESPLSMGAAIGVEGFFVLSGYLVWTSLERSSSLRLYAEKRVRRLYPGYATVIIACAAGALIVSPEARDRIGDVARYLGWNLVFLNFGEPNLPGVFAGNRFTEVNGALWTLKIEVMFYIVLPLLALILRAAGRMRWLLMALVYAGAEAWRWGFQYMGQAAPESYYSELARQLPGQMSFFITGIALAAWRNQLSWRSLLAPAGIVLLVVSIILPAAEPVRALGLGIVAVWLATGLPRLFDAAKFGDLSYGLYIVHFPIIQTVVTMGVFAASAPLGLAASASAALVAALLLWWLVERPALRSDSAYRARSVGAQ